MPTMRCRLRLCAGHLLIMASLFGAQFLNAQASSNNFDTVGNVQGCGDSALNSLFVPVDSWIYPAMLRLYSMGYVDDVFLGVRPWTRSSIGHMLEEVDSRIEDEEADGGASAADARSIYDAVQRELFPADHEVCKGRKESARVESVYTVARGISGTPLRDSYHLGSTIINDYGRPYENGLNNYTGASGFATAGRFTLYARGEFQGAQSASGYSPALYQALAEVDGTIDSVTHLAYPGQITIPGGPIQAASQGRFLEAYVAGQWHNNLIFFGK